MDFYGFKRDAAIAHFDGLTVEAASRGTHTLRGWNRLRPEHILDLLDGAAADARSDGRNLAALLVRAPWRISAHTSAQGKANQLVSNVREIAVAVAGREFKLQCTESPLLQLERIG